jgi:hypothetical protein
LWIDQNDIGADRLHSPYTVANQQIGFRIFIASEYGVGAHLPEHQVWMLGGDTLVEAGPRWLCTVARVVTMPVSPCAWYVAYSSPNLAGIQAAVSAGSG